MKFLFLFIDTLRPNLMNVINPKFEESELDKLLKNLGGTIYINCFTPGPDTPRGLACFWTGLIPMKNGCDKRIRYPKFYLNGNVENLWDTFKNYGYGINIYSRQQISDVGVFPESIQPKKYQDIKEFISSVSIVDNSVTFIALTDYCDGLGEYNYSMNGVKKGHKKTSDALNLFFNKYNKNEFDYIFIFSDHGHKTLKERTESAQYLLSKDRTNIFAMIRKKNDSDIIYNEKMCSIIDFYPTIKQIIGENAPDYLDGISLISQEEHEYIVAEDHNYFTPETNQLIDRWAVIRKNSIYFRDLSGWTNSPETMEENDRIIARHSQHFKIAEKEKQVLESYSKIYLYHTYSDGEEIVKHNDMISRCVNIIDRNPWIKNILKKLIKKYC